MDKFHKGGYRFTQAEEVDDDELRKLKNALSSNLLIANPNIGLKIKKNLILETDRLMKVELKDVVSDDCVVICRISSDHCSSCDYEVLRSLINTNANIPEHKIIVIGSFYNTKMIESYKEENQINFKVYNLKKEFNIGAEVHNFPYLMVLNRDMEVMSCFFPEKSLPELTDDYLIGIEHLFH